MNRGAISVIYLALSAVCLIGLYGVYQPQINTSADQVFGRVETFTNNGFKAVDPSNKPDTSVPSGKDKVIIDNSADGNANKTILVNKTSQSGLKQDAVNAMNGVNVVPSSITQDRSNVFTVHMQNGPFLHQGDKKETGVWYGLNYIADQHGDVLLNSGNAYSPDADPWSYGRPAAISNAVHIKASDNINMLGSSYDLGMFSNCSNLQSVDLGNNFDTSNATDISSLFANDTKLIHINLGPKFNTKNIQSNWTLETGFAHMLEGVPAQGCASVKPYIPSGYWNAKGDNMGHSGVFG